MDITKVNTLTADATNILRDNLTDENVKFKQFGSAFVFDQDKTRYNADVFDGLWVGFNANIELQEANDFDRKEYSHF